MLRAGNSLSDKATKEELNQYFKRLDDNEKSVLILFLKELSKILTGAVDAEDALDPSDPSAFFSITKKGSGSEPNKQDIQKQSQQAGAGTGAPKGSASIDIVNQPKQGLEDTTPPIKVNESQDIDDLKRKVRKLMRS